MMSQREKLAAIRQVGLEKKQVAEDNFTNDVIKNLEGLSGESKDLSSEKPTLQRQYKLTGVVKEPKNTKVGFVITKTANDNVRSYAKEAGFVSVNDFVNHLFEHLYEFL